MKKSPRCRDGGYIVSPSYEIPTDPQIYLKKSERQIVGCNRLFCNRCKTFVRQWPGYALIKARWALKPAEHEELYRTKDPAKSLLIGPYRRFRTYSCKCWADSITGYESVELSYMEFDHWICAGHPQKETSTPQNNEPDEEE